MKTILICTLLVAGSRSLPVAVGARNSETDSKAAPTHRQYGEGGSKTCDQLNGAKKDECLQDEGAKTDRKQEPAAAAPDSSQSAERSPASGDTAPDAKDVKATQKSD